MDMSELRPRSDDLEATWNFIEPAINQILGRDGVNVNVSKRVNRVLSPVMYMDVYTAIYNYCVNKSRSSGQFSADRQVQNRQQSILVGSEIYEKLKAFLKSYILSFVKEEDESFLQFYVRRWKRFTIGAIFLNHAFDYMNRYWVQKERSDGKRDIFDVNTLCLITWKEFLFNPNSDLLTKEILEQITLERDGNKIQRSVVTTAIKSFVALGIDPQDLKKLNLNVYIQSFEKPFLNNTTEYYIQFSNNYLNNHSITEYIFEASNIIYREEQTMSMYWDDHTRKPLSEALNVVLIISHKQKLEKDFVELLESKDQTNISALYALMQRDFSLLPELALTFEKFVKQTGEMKISKLLTNIKSVNSESLEPSFKRQNINNSLLSPKEYIKKLIEVYRNFQTICHECFLSDPLFTKALDNACKSYINENEYAASSNGSKTPEILARYSDQLLKKSTKPENVKDMSIDDIMMIFKFLTDKDAFESHYRRLFAKRLIHGTSTSDADEESIIQRLQSENSMEYTGKIAKMFQDVRLSKILEDEFDNMIKNQPNFSRKLYPELEVFVLAETMWPFQYNQDIEYKLPQELAPLYEKLVETYTSKHNGRILKWLFPLCRGELTANIGKPGKQPFLFTVTLFQMSILLMFNNEPVLSMEQIQEGTNLSVNNIAAAMIPFIKYKLIQQQPTGLESLIKLDTTFKLATPYKAIKTKINFASGVKNDVINNLHAAKQHRELTENEKIEKELNAERQVYLEACIVRIMKANRTMSHTTLLNDCIAQAHNRFNPKVSMIKKAIDNLIHKEYLKRSNDGESYEYLS